MGRWVCKDKDCGFTYDVHTDISVDDDRVHNLEMGKPVCANESHGEMKWEPEKAPRKLPEFDYTFQLWRDAEGNVVPEQEDWNFSCNKCYAPAKFNTCNAYFEYYTCLNCGHEIKVN